MQHPQRRKTKMALKVPARGPINAEIMIVGEAPGFDEEIAGLPFVGTSGNELKRMLREVGIDMDACYITNVCKFRPPGNDMADWLTTKKTDVKKRGYVERAGRYMHLLVLD